MALPSASSPLAALRLRLRLRRPRSPAPEDRPHQVRYPVTLTDANGKTFTFDRPQKLGCVWVGCSEMLVRLRIADLRCPYQRPELLSFRSPPTQLVADTATGALGGGGRRHDHQSRPGLPSADALTTAAPIFYMQAWNASGRGGGENLDNLRTMGQLTGRSEQAAAAMRAMSRPSPSSSVSPRPRRRIRAVAVLFRAMRSACSLEIKLFCVLMERNGLGRCIENAGRSSPASASN